VLSRHQLPVDVCPLFYEGWGLSRKEVGLRASSPSMATVINRTSVFDEQRGGIDNSNNVCPSFTGRIRSRDVASTKIAPCAETRISLNSKRNERKAEEHLLRMELLQQELRHKEELHMISMKIKEAQLKKTP